MWMLTMMDDDAVEGRSCSALARFGAEKRSGDIRLPWRDLDDSVVGDPWHPGIRLTLLTALAEIPDT